MKPADPIRVFEMLCANAPRRGKIEVCKAGMGPESHLPGEMGGRSRHKRIFKALLGNFTRPMTGVAVIAIAVPTGAGQGGVSQ